MLLAGCGGTSARSAREPEAGPRPSPSSPSSTTAGPARLTSARCADLVVLGLRGQGQSSRGHHGAGRDVDGVARAMLAHLRPGTTMRVDGVRFPARSGGDAAYSQDVRTGERLVRERMVALSQRCPASMVALVGYSQGAEVVHRSAAALDEPGQVDVVVLMGDPLRNPGDLVTTLRLGAAALDGQGNGGVGARFPGAVRARVVEVCAEGDDVCNAPPAGRVGPPSATHRSVYKSRAVQRRVAARAARVVVGTGG